MTSTVRDRVRSAGWSGAYLAATRISTVIAVPLVLDGVGTRLYAAWVLAGTLVFSQGLVDFGVASATIRYVALGAAERSREAVLRVLRLSAWFYLGLALVIGSALVALADPLVGTVAFLREDPWRTDGVALLRYAALAFVLTNIVVLLSACVQGIGHVDRAYRAQTLGWLAYIPVLATGLALDGGVHALGVAWLTPFALQCVLLAVAAARGLREVGGARASDPVRFGDLLSLGARWQVSAYADFATFQLPRLVAGLALTSSEVVIIDLGLRGAQLVVTPLFAVYPLILPAAAHIWKRQGEAGLSLRLARWTPALAITVILIMASAIPLLPSLIAVWSGVTLADWDVLVSTLIVIGVTLHAATGPFTTALLATGDVRPVVDYKLVQLLLAAGLLVVASLLGVRAIAAAVCVALAGPALWFLARMMRRFPPVGDAARALPRARIVAAVAVCMVPPSAALLITRDAGAVTAMAVTVGALLPATGAALLMLDPRRLLLLPPAGP